MTMACLDIARPLIYTESASKHSTNIYHYWVTFPTSSKFISKGRRFAVLSHFVVPSLPLSYFSVLPQSFPSELLLYIMKKVELVVCFLIWYCSRNGAVLLGTQKAGGGFVCSFPVPFSFFRNHLGFLARKFWCETFCETSLSLPCIGFVTLSRKFAVLFGNCIGNVWAAISQEIPLADPLEYHYLSIQHRKFFRKQELCQEYFHLMFF